MEYQVHSVTLPEMNEIKNNLIKNNSIFIGEINIKSDIKRLKEYFITVGEVFRFPIPSKGFDGYNDWIRDLDWLDKEGYILIIYNFKKFLRKEQVAKKEIIDNFNNTIFPFWKEEVTRVVVEGEVKPFTVYLVD